MVTLFSTMSEKASEKGQQGGVVGEERNKTGGLLGKESEKKNFESRLGLLEIKSGEYNSTLSHVVPDIKELKKSTNQVQTDIKSIQDAPARDAQLSTDDIVKQN